MLLNCFQSYADRAFHGQKACHANFIFNLKNGARFLPALKDGVSACQWMKKKRESLSPMPMSGSSSRSKRSKGAAPVSFETAAGGFDCLAKLETFKPDLVVVDLMLSQIHGMEILRKIKTDPRTNQVGVIMTSAHAMSQNYRSALVLNCDYFLRKALRASRKFFPFSSSSLKMSCILPLFPAKRSSMEGKHCYLPKNAFTQFLHQILGHARLQPRGGTGICPVRRQYLLFRNPPWPRSDHRRRGHGHPLLRRQPCQRPNLKKSICS